MVIPKSHRGRTKRAWVSFFNEECQEVLKRYLASRNDKNPKLFPLAEKPYGKFSEKRMAYI
jgi:hypothetical protein